MLWGHTTRETNMQTTTATIPASQLAEMLKSYGDLPVHVQVITTEYGQELSVEEGNEGVHLELNARPDGSRFVAVVGFREAGE
jgi:hypothetical protein